MNKDRRSFIKRMTVLGAGVVLNPLTIPPSVAKPGAESVRIGFVGVGKRGTTLVEELLKIGGVEISAVCDVNEENLRRAQKIIQEAGHEKPEGYSRSETDFKRLCDRDDLDIVVNATPWEWHTPILLAAMNAGKHAATEVPAAITEEECWKLVETSERTGKFCTMLENVSYYRNVMTISKMIHQGVFGDMLHAEVGYQHDIRPRRFDQKVLENFQETGKAHWRVRHHEKRNGNLYPTHAIGPVAQWMDINRGDRFSHLVSMSTPSKGLNIYAARQYGEDHPLAQKDYAHGDINTTLIKTEKGLTVTLYHDVATYRPYDLIFRVQGADGIYSGSHDGIYIQGLSSKDEEWDDFDTAGYVKPYVPKIWKKQGEDAQGFGHHGGDYFVLNRVVEAVRNGVQPDIDVYDAVTWSVITELTERSVRNGSKPVDFPDFTKGAWKTRSPKNSIFVQ